MLLYVDCVLLTNQIFHSVMYNDNCNVFNLVGQPPEEVHSSTTLQSICFMLWNSGQAFVA